MPNTNTITDLDVNALLAKIARLEKEKEASKANRATKAPYVERTQFTSQKGKPGEKVHDMLTFHGGDLFWKGIPLSIKKARHVVENFEQLRKALEMYDAGKLEIGDTVS